ncbi:MAG: hypothetical protein ACREJX_17385, partial [Polyangiaceae bacterium]
MEIRNEIPEAKPTDPDLSDADATLEFHPGAHAPKMRDTHASSEPVIRTMEVTEADIIEVQAAVAALEKEEAECATMPVVTADVIASLPPAVLPPKRVAPPSVAKNIFPRQWLLVAAAVGTWAFFVSIASLAAFGVRSLVRAHSEDAVTASIAPPPVSQEASPQVAPKRARFIAEPVPPRAHATDTSDEAQTSDDSRASDDSQTSSDESNRSTSRFGILRFAHATNGALVDGEPRRVTGDALFLSCGAHRIRTSRSRSRTVRV